MGNRMLKESICVSEDIDALGWFAEVFFYRLLVNCDDYGRMDGRAAILKARLFPLREGLALEMIDDALRLLASRGMVRPYVVDGQRFLRVCAFSRHQKVRYMKEKYPAPPADADGGACAADCGESPCGAADAPPEAQAQTEAQTEEEAEAEAEPGAEADPLARVAAAAASLGMVYAKRDAQIAAGLVREYSLPWVLEAMDRSADGNCRSWRYIKGILKRWRAAGEMDARGAGKRAEGPGPGGKLVRAQMYTQVGYSEAELQRLVREV